MELMSRLLQEGGKIIYVAPSGGRDRRNAQGIVEVAPFDPAQHRNVLSHGPQSQNPHPFLSLRPRHLRCLPPPETIQKELGETRSAKRTPIHLAFAPEFDMEKFPGSEENDKTLRRQHKAEAIWKIVSKNYELLTRAIA